ncbi:hypothetical protein MASR2M78_26100 [Treponema sp.]
MRASFLFFVMMLYLVTASTAEDSKDPSMQVPASTAAEEAGYLEVLDNAIAKAFEELGLGIPEGLQRSCTLEDETLSWWIQVYDDEGYLIAADSYTSTAGLSVRFLLSASAKNVAERASLVYESAIPNPELWVSTLKFSSKDDGARVYLGTAEMKRELGKIQNGLLIPEYIPLIKGETYFIQAEKEGYWPAIKSIKREMDGKPLPLPSLMKKTKTAVSAIYSLDKGLGGTLSIRRYLIEDSFYARFDLAGWMQYDGEEGSEAVYHRELRLAFAVLWPRLPQNRFRLGLGSSFSVLDTYFSSAANIGMKYGSDLCVDPFYFNFEFHSPHWALFLEQRLSYSFGLEGGYLRRGWLETEALGPLRVSLGVLRKW